jgi:hypothetical protein
LLNIVTMQNEYTLLHIYFIIIIIIFVALKLINFKMILVVFLHYFHIIIQLNYYFILIFTFKNNFLYNILIVRSYKKDNDFSTIHLAKHTY